MTLKRLSEINQPGLFCLAQCELLSDAENDKNVKIQFEEDCRVATNFLERIEISTNRGDGLCRNPGMGNLTIYNQGGKKFFLFVWKDEKAPSYRNQLSLTSDTTTDPDQWFHPAAFAIKGGRSDMGILIDGNCALFEDKRVYYKKLYRSINQKHREAAEKLKIPFTGNDFKAFVRKVMLPQERTLTLICQLSAGSFKEMSHSGLLVPDKGTNTVDLIEVTEVFLPIGQLSPFDCESMPVKDGKKIKNKLIDRKIYLFPEETIRAGKQPNSITGATAFFQTGERHDLGPLNEMEFKMLPNLIYALRAYGVLPDNLLQS